MGCPECECNSCVWYCHGRSFPYCVYHATEPVVCFRCSEHGGLQDPNAMERNHETDLV